MGLTSVREKKKFRQMKIKMNKKIKKDNTVFIGKGDKKFLPLYKKRQMKKYFSFAAYTHKKNCAILFCRNLPKRKHRRLLLQSYLMAHVKIRLVLLYSYPDTVHGITLHKTLLSTSLAVRKPSINVVEKGVRL